MEGLTADSTDGFTSGKQRIATRVRRERDIAIPDYQGSDDGLTWGEPLNLTHLKKKVVFAPAPGQGITMTDGTLVLPPGQDEPGAVFNITWSKDGGKS